MPEPVPIANRGESFDPGCETRVERTWGKSPKIIL